MSAEILLKNIRNNKSNKPELVIKYGPSLLSSSSGNDYYMLHEQIFIASLELGLQSVGEKSLNVLKNKFPNSCRVSILIGMEDESKGNYDKALELYNKLLIDNPGNIKVMQRKVCVYKASCHLKNAIDEIHTILKYYPGDVSTWQELSDIHLSLSDYKASAFCHEELVLLDANCSSYHTHLADIYYTIGDSEHILKARKHYTMSLALQNGQSNFRALYGLISACKYLSEEYSKSQNNNINDSDVNNELLKFGEEQIGLIKFENENTKKVVIDSL